MFTTIIVPVDSTQESLRALMPARVIADAANAELVVTSVVVNNPDLIAQEHDLKAKIDKLGLEVDKVTAYVNRYSINEGLAELISSSEKPLIVLATKGRSHLAKIYEGVSEEILHKWPEIPTLMVGPEVDIANFTLDGPIFACVDPSEESLAILPPVARMSNEFNLAPWILTVADPDKQTGAANRRVSSGRTAPAPGETLVETAGVHSVADQLHQMGTSDVNWEVLHGKNPAKSIAEYAGTMNASIVAVASRNRGGLSRLIMGSVAIEVVTQAPCPVLVVHAEAE